MDGRILLMDYSGPEREKVRLVLENIGNFDITEISDYRQFSGYQGGFDNFSLIIMDIAFPTQAEGFEILQALNSSTGSQVPIIAISRDDKPETMYKALKQAAKDFIVKPYPLKRLENSIRSLVKVRKKFLYDTHRIQDIRMTFDEYMARQFKFMQRFGKPFSIILITMGEKAKEKNAQAEADPALKEKASRSVYETAGKLLRSTDSVVVNASMDILVLLPGTGAEGAGVVQDRIRNMAASALSEMGLKYDDMFYTAGVCYPADGEDFQVLMETAFKRIAEKEMLKSITSIPAGTRREAARRYNQFNRWF